MATKNSEIYSEEERDDSQMDVAYGDFGIKPRQLLEIGDKTTTVADLRNRPGLADAISEKVLEHYAQLFAGDEDMTIAAYFSSVEEVNNAQAKAESEENKEGKSWIDFMPTEIQEKVAANRSWDEAEDNALHEYVYGPRPYEETERNTFKKRELEEIDKRLQEVYPELKNDPITRAAVVKKLKLEQDEQEKQFKYDQNIRVNRAKDAVVKSGGDVFAIDENTWGGLSFQSLQEVLHTADIVRNGRPALGIDDARKLSDAALRDMTFEQVQRKTYELSGNDRNTLWTRWVHAKEQDWEAQEKQQQLSRLSEMRISVAGYDINRSLIKDVLRDGYANFADFEKKNPEAAEALVGIMQNELHFYYQSQGDTESQKSFFKVKDDMTNLFSSAYLNFKDPVNNPLNYTWKSLPDTKRTCTKWLVYELAQRENNVQEPTEEQCDKAYYSLLLNPHKITSVLGLHLNSKLEDAIQAEARRTRGEELRGGELLLEYVLEDLGIRPSKAPIETPMESNTEYGSYGVSPE